MVRVTKVFGGPKHELVLVRLPKKENSNAVSTYIIDKTQLSCKVEIDLDKKSSLASDKLFVSKKINSKSKIFFFVYNNILFKIEGALAIHVVDFPPHKAVKSAYVLLILTQDNMEFYSFSTKHPNNYLYLGFIDSSYIHSFFCDQINCDTFSLKLTFHENFFYIDYPYDTASILKKDKKLIIVRFNPYCLQCYTIPDNSKAILNASENPCGLPKYYITADCGIFDVFHFKFFNLANMFKSIGNNYMDFSYAIFTTPNEQEFVFVSEKPIDFLKFESPRFLKEYQYGATVKGVLYSLTRNEFVLPLVNDKSMDSPWANFFIYDSGVPHVFEINSNSPHAAEPEYGVIFIDKEHAIFSKMETTAFPTFISHIYAKDMPIEEATAIVKKRIIFAKLKNETINPNEEITTSDSMIVMDDNLHILYINNSAVLEAILSHSYSSTFFAERLRLAFIANQNQFVGNNMNIITYAKIKDKVFHLLQRDSFIFKTNQGEFGEYILVPLDDNFEIDYRLSFFYYSLFNICLDFDLANNQKRKNCKDIPFLKVMCRRNDFENQTYIVNLNTFQIFEYEEFVAYITKEFSIQI